MTQTKPNASDLNLARQANDGDHNALQEIYLNHSSPLFGYIHHLMDGHPEDVEEIWQESWIAAVHAMQTFRGDSSLFTWLCSIARRKVADYYRKRQLHFEPVDENLIIDAGLLPEEILIKGTVKAEVIRALQELQPNQRQAIIARYVDGLSIQQIAQMQKKSYKAVESLLSRARQAFQNSFGGKNG